MLTAATLCSGIGAPETAMPEWRWLWCAEHEAFPSAVLAKRFGHPNLGDITAPDFVERAVAIGIPDVIVAGTPCQSFSVAGLRKGLADPRGNLTLQTLKIVDTLKPKRFLWENVPGIISIKDDPLGQFLDALEEIGYVYDIDILDAQFFGLAQRRRRVFVCAFLLEDFLSRKTTISALTLIQCLTEILALILAAARASSVTDSKSWAFDATEPRLSLERRMTQFGLLSDGDQALRLAAILDAILPLSGPELNALGLGHGSARCETSADTRLSVSTTATEQLGECQSIARSWKEVLAGPLATARSYITSTSAREITESQIFGCAKTILLINERITPSAASWPNYWTAAQSISTAMKVFIEYARQSSSDLFADQAWVRSWGDFLRQARSSQAVSGDPRDDRGAKVLSIGKSLPGNYTPRVQTREKPTSGTVGAIGRGTLWRQVAAAFADPRFGVQEKAGTLGGASQSGGFRTTDLDHKGADSDTKEGHLIPVAFKASHFTRGKDGSPQDVAPPLAVEDDRGDQSPLVLAPHAVAIQERAVSANPKCGPDGAGVSIEKAYTLEARTTTQAVALNLRGRDGGVNAELADKASLRAADGGSSRSYVAFHGTQDPDVSGDLSPPLGTNHGQECALAFGWAIRRLTPTEAARLQGFPDDQTRIEWRGKPASQCPDGPQHKGYGNSMAVPVIRWICKRIEFSMRGEGNG